MLAIFLERKSSNILTKEACPPVITAASSVTSDPNVHFSRLRSRRFKGSCQQELLQALYLRQHIRLHSTSGSIASAAVCSCQSEWQAKEEQIKALQEKTVEAQWQPWL
jgi:hypothetical protein